MLFPGHYVHMIYEYVCLTKGLHNVGWFQLITPGQLVLILQINLNLVLKLS